MRGPIFGQANGVASYQVPRAYNFTVGFRF
jgi:hypothetical protein